MTRTPTPKRKAKPPPKLRGDRQPLGISLPPDLVVAVDAIAEQEGRTRVRQIEMVLRQFVDTNSIRKRP